MNKINKGIILSLCITVVLLLCIALYPKKEQSTYKLIDIERYRAIIEKQDCIVLIGRASCSYCAIADLVMEELTNNIDTDIALYKLDLESYYKTPDYEDIKKELGISYVPTVLYIKNGNLTYAINSPVAGEYFDEDSDGAKREAIREEARDKISDFIDGCTGRGEVINEELRREVIEAKPLK